MTRRWPDQKSGGNAALPTCSATGFRPSLPICLLGAGPTSEAASGTAPASVSEGLGKRTWVGRNRHEKAGRERLCHHPKWLWHTRLEVVGGALEGAEVSRCVRATRTWAARLLRGERGPGCLG